MNESEIGRQVRPYCVYGFTADRAASVSAYLVVLISAVQTLGRVDLEIFHFIALCKWSLFNMYQ